eukprot:gene8998-8132_t
MVLANNQFLPDKIKAADPSLEWHRERLDSLQLQLDDCESMRVVKRVGLCMVSTEDLKARVTPSPDRCLVDLRDLLPVIAREKNSSLLTEMNEAVARLDTKPGTVQEFVAFIEFHTYLSGRMETIEGAFEHVKDLYALLDADRIAVHPDDSMAYSKGTVSQILKLRVAISSTEDAKDNSIAHFSGEVLRELDSLRKQTAEVQEKTMDPMVMDENADPEEVVSYLVTQSMDLEEVKLKEQQYTQYQELFRVDVTYVNEIQDVTKVVGDYMKLWTGLHEWSQKVSEWNGTPFLSIDVPSLEEEVNRYAKVSAQVMRALPDNPVSAKLKNAVDDFKGMLPVVQALRNPHLQKHHRD